MKSRVMRATLLAVSLFPVLAAQGFAKAQSPEAQPNAVFAIVNGEAILQATYETALRVAGRQRFYHGKAPEEELIAFRKEVAERVIEERIFHQEAVRQGLAADSDWVEAEFAKIERRYSVSPQWRESGESLQQQVRQGLAERNLIQQVDESLRQTPPASDAETRAYYREHPDKFTSPEKIRVSTIMLKVEPWQPSEVWEDSREKARRMLSAIRAGEPFDTYAQRHPPTAEGQMGYLHRGMLGESAQSALDPLEVGEITGVVTLLEGVAIFRLDERKPAQLNPYAAVRERAAALLARERSESLYRQRVDSLRSGAEVEFMNPRYYEVVAVGGLHDRSHAVAMPKNSEGQ